MEPTPMARKWTNRNLEKLNGITALKKEEEKNICSVRQHPETKVFRRLEQQGPYLHQSVILITVASRFSPFMFEYLCCSLYKKFGRDKFLFHLV